jgi:transposase
VKSILGLDVHQATIVVAVLDSTGKLVTESILETEAATILQFFAGLRGTLSVTFEEGTWSVWLYDLLQPHVHKLVVCNPRKNALLKDGNKSDRIDARKLAELLRHGKHQREQQVQKSPAQPVIFVKGEPFPEPDHDGRKQRKDVASTSQDTM